VEEKQRLEEQIQDAGALLQSKNVDIETISEYSQLKEHLAKHNLSLEHHTRLLSILQTIKQIGYEPVKIVAAFASMKSLMQKERQLKKKQSAGRAHGKISTSTTSGHGNCFHAN
jgi:methionyl-tRNA formyltransferase